MTTKHILLKTPLLVHPIMQSLEQGADFSQLAREYSACPSGVNGGDLGNLAIEDFPKAIQNALKQSDNTYHVDSIASVPHPVSHHLIGPIESTHGLHLFQID